jgi:drug/metabolite transporter (DMT)-like permease
MTSPVNCATLQRQQTIHPVTTDKSTNDTTTKTTNTSFTWIDFAPAIFVLLWSTGFIGSKYGIPFAEPFTLTSVRMVIVVAILGVISFVTKAPWPATPRAAVHIAIAGLLVHATYLSGVLYAIVLKLPLGFIALIAGVQPILTAVLGNMLLKERLNARQWFGMAMGLAGVVLVIASKFSLGATNWSGLAAAAVALIGITLGTLYQKRFCANMDLRTGGVIQYAATGTMVFLLALIFESRNIEWTQQFMFAVAWLAIVLSIGAIGLLYVMIRRGAASKVASLFFLTPSVTALMAFVLFRESLSVLAITGLLVTAVGVALVMRNDARR